MKKELTLGEASALLSVAERRERVAQRLVADIYRILSDTILQDAQEHLASHEENIDLANLARYVNG